MIRTPQQGSRPQHRNSHSRENLKAVTNIGKSTDLNKKIRPVASFVNNIFFATQYTPKDNWLAGVAYELTRLLDVSCCFSQQLFPHLPNATCVITHNSHRWKFLLAEPAAKMLSSGVRGRVHYATMIEDLGRRSLVFAGQSECLVVSLAGVVCRRIHRVSARGESDVEGCLRAFLVYMAM